MIRQLNWQYNEMTHAGADFNDPAQAEAWDAKRESLGDIKADNAAVIQTLQLEPGHALIDVGAGTGSLAIQAASECLRVYAVDISPAMLEVARKKAAAANARNIRFCPGGFLSYNHTDPPVDAVVSQMALHHLPDFWKAVALRRIAQMLKPAGKFYLADVVFSCHVDDHAQTIKQAINDWSSKAGEDYIPEIAAHFRDEYSTTAWIMEGLLTRAGFRIVSANYPNPIQGRYLCEKIA